MVVVVTEPVGNLLPQHTLDCTVLVDRLLRTVGKRAFNPSVVVVIVQHDVEAVVDAVVYNLLHAVEPKGVDVVVRVAMHIPRARYAHGTETLGLDEVDDLLRGLRALPGRLPVNGVAYPVAGARLHGVAEVPARIHIGGQLHSGGLLRHGVAYR